MAMRPPLAATARCSRAIVTARAMLPARPARRLAVSPAPHSARAFQAWLPGLGRWLVPSARRAALSPAGLDVSGGESSTSSADGEGEEGSSSTPCPPVADLVRAGTPLGLGFAAGGLLFPYLSGVAFGLADAGIIDPQRTPLAGASAGALIAACVGSGMDRAAVDAACDALAADCRASGTRGRLGSVLEDFLEAHLPPDAADRLNGRVYVAVTRVGSRRVAAAAAGAAGGGRPGGTASSAVARSSAWAADLLARLPAPAGLLVSDFASRADLISALLTSCHIPLWMDGRLARTFRGEAHLDGGLTQFLPLPPTSDGAGVGVCAFPSRRTLLPALGADRLIAPDVYDPAWDVNLPTLLSWAFHPAGEAEFSALSVKGEADAAAWAAESGVGAAVAEVRARAAAEAGAPVLERPVGPAVVPLVDPVQ